MQPQWQLNQVIRRADRGMTVSRVPSATQAAAQ